MALTDAVSQLLVSTCLAIFIPAVVLWLSIMIVAAQYEITWRQDDE